MSIDTSSNITNFTYVLKTYKSPPKSKIYDEEGHLMILFKETTAPPKPSHKTFARSQRRTWTIYKHDKSACEKCNSLSV